VHRERFLARNRGIDPRHAECTPEDMTRLLRASLFVSSVLAFASVGCGGGVQEGDGSPAPSDSVDEGALATKGGLDKAIYVAVAGQKTPKHDFIPAMSVGIDTDFPNGHTPSQPVRFKYDYPGSPSRVTGTCLGTWEIKSESLALSCPVSTVPFKFKIDKRSAEQLTLKNENDESFILEKVDPSAKSDLRAECDTKAFKVRLDVKKGDADRRVLLTVTPKKGEMQDRAPHGTFVLRGKPGAATTSLSGTDFYDGDVTLKLPTDPAGSFKASLRYVDYGGPFQMSPAEHALECKTSS